ncbi:MAG: stage III sporulation protein AE [Clostridiaceae bacterium]
MKHFKRILIISIFINILFTLPVKADEQSGVLERLEQNNSVQQLYDYVTKMKSDSELMNQLDVTSYIKSVLKEGKGNISFSQVAKALLSASFKEIRSVLQLMVSIIVIAIICSLLRNLQDAFKGTHGDIAFYACYAILIIIISKSVLITIELAKTTIQSLTDFMMALIPVLVLMIASVGGVVEAASIDPVLMGAVTIAPRIYVNFIIPMILMSFVLNLVNNLSKEHKINNVCKLFKQVTLWCQGILVTIFIGLLTIRGIAAATIDAVTLKTAKFAVDNFVPIVGKAFSDAIASVAGYAILLKNAISILGLMIVIFIVSIPIIKLLMVSIMFKLSASLVEPICDSRITSCISSVGEFVVMIISCILSLSLMFFVMVSIMAAAGRFVIGG